MGFEKRLDRVQDAVIQRQVEQQAAAAVPLLERLGIPPDEWPAIRHGIESGVRWRLANPHPTAEQVEARIQQVAAAQAAELGCTPEDIIAEAERIADLLPEGRE